MIMISSSTRLAARTSFRLISNDYYYYYFLNII